MKSMLKFCATALAVTSLLTACGGGGGGAGTSGPTATAALTTENQDTAAQEAVSTAVLPLSSVTTLVGAQTVDERALFRWVQGRIDALPDYFKKGAASNTLTGVVQSDTMTCSGGGTLTYSATIANASTGLSNGDSLQITASACKEGGETMSGGMAIHFNTLTGTFGTIPYSGGLTLTFNNLAMTTANFSTQMNGDFGMTISVSASNTGSITLSATSLAVSATYGAAGTRTRTLSGYNATETKAPGSSAGIPDTYFTSTTINGTVNSSALSSRSLTIATLVPFVQRSSDPYPRSGSMVLTGAANSRIRITGLNNTQFQQELDANGDGTYESSSTRLWSSVL